MSKLFKRVTKILMKLEVDWWPLICHETKTWQLLDSSIPKSSLSVLSKYWVERYSGEARISLSRSATQNASGFQPLCHMRGQDKTPVLGLCYGISVVYFPCVQRNGTASLGCINYEMKSKYLIMAYLYIVNILVYWKHTDWISYILLEIILHELTI